MRDARLHIAADRGRDGALIFPNDRPGLVRTENRDLGRKPLDDRLGGELVRGIAIGMQERDHDPLGARRAGALDRPCDARLVEFVLNTAIRLQAAGDAEDEIACDERRGPLRQQVVHVRDLEACDLEHVAEMLRREQGEAQPLALDDRVDADRGAMGKVADLLRPDAVALAHQTNPLEHFRARLVRPREHLQRLETLRRLVEQREIRKRSADIDTYSITHDILSPPRS